MIRPFAARPASPLNPKGTLARDPRYPFRLRMALLAMVSAVMFSSASAALGQMGRKSVPAPLVTVAGGQGEAKVEGVNSNGKLMFAIDEQQQELQAAEIVRFGFPVENQDDAIVIAADGSHWVCNQDFDPLTIKDEQLEFLPKALPQLASFPLDEVRGILFQPMTNRRKRDAAIREIVEAEGNSDVVLLINGDRLQGLVQGLSDELSMKTATGETTLGLDRVRAIIFNPALLRKAAETKFRVLVGTRDGSRLVAKSLAGNGPSIAVETVGGRKAPLAVANIRYLQSLGGGVQYLSDIEPTSFRHQPFLSLSWSYQRDRNVLGGALRSHGKRYIKGLGLHSTSGLVYKLDSKYRRFEAELAVDDSTERRGSVVLRVYTDDGSGQWESKFTSKIVRGGDPPQKISADLSGAQRLSLILDMADRGDQLDHANLLDARLVP